ncbi:hypothetical protein [Variovorax paradoxus]|uniref:hypothetical protein n=1 Tax=Variovorax paradoxus TaxID=34073 RepID=UPI0029C85379|nr:hypothetical protein [Variovorax paradoxus]WPH22274.1 hypothetical protein RZE78_08950 [Variovorax paradoxus]
MRNGKDENHERYCVLMGEIKLRVRSLEVDAHQVESFGLELKDGQVFVYERACLQLRKILELIAFATLVANKQRFASAHPNFAEFWRAHKIMAKLKAINALFYPVPVRETISNRVLNIEDVAEGLWLTEDECSELIDMCGERLHIPNPFAPTKIADLGRPIAEWIARIKALLSTHTVALTDDDVILVRMSDWEKYGGVELLALGAVRP